MAGTVRIAILADAKGVKPGVTQATGLLNSLKSKAAGAGSVMKGVLAASVITAGASAVASGVGIVVDKFGEAVDAASALQQSTGAVDAVFGRSAGAIKKSATSAAQSLGLSRNAYQELASTLGAGLKNQGIRDFAGQTQDVIKLGGDLAAQFGGSTSQAVEAIGSLMRGEADPIEKYGVSIKQSAINAELAAKGQGKLTGAARTQAEAQARLSLLFRQTKDAQGAFGRESGSLANIQQRNAAATENLKAKFGTVFLPIMTQVQNAIANQVLPAFERFLPVVQKIGTAVGPVFESIKRAVTPVIATIVGFFSGGSGGLNVAGFIAKITPIKDGLVTVFSSLVTVLQTVAPIVLSVLSTLVNAYQTNAPKIGAALQTVGQIVTQVGELIKTVWTTIGPIILPIVTSVFGLLVGVIGGALKIISGVIKTVLSVIKGDWSGAWAGIQQIAEGAVQIVTSQIQAFKSILSTIWGGIKGAATTVWSGIKTAITNAATSLASSVLNKVTSIKTTMGNAWTAIKTAASLAFNSLKTTITTKITEVVTKVKELPSKAKSALSNLSRTLYSAGSDLVGGFISGISGSLSSVISKAKEIASSAINAAKEALGIASPSKVFRQIGAYVGRGFVQGLQGSQAQAKSAVSKMVTLLNREAKAKGAAGARARAALKIVNRLDNRALSLAKARTAATAKLSAAQAKLNDLVKQRNDFAAGVKDSAKSYASIIGIKLDDDLPLTNGTLIQGLRERLAAIKNFQVKVAQLKKQGLNAATLQQIIAAGVEGGTEVANTLATGGAGVIRQINSLQGQINAQATSLGNTTAGYFYSTGIAAQQGLIKGLTANQKALQKAAAQIAKTLSSAVKKALGIKSPSKVFAEIGDNVTKGLTIGLDDNLTKRAGAVLAGSLVSGFGMPTLTATAGAERPYAPITYVINVAPTVGATPAEQGRVIVSAIKEYERIGGRR